MRSVRLLLLAAACPAVGCTWMREHGWTDRPRAGGPIEPKAAAALVGHLNGGANVLRSVEYDASARASGKGLPFPVTLHGSLAATQPRSFRMVAKGNIGGKVDLGSNDQQFWVYMEVPNQPLYYRYASHADFEAGRAPLPGGVPFDPDWVMQALGMITFDPNLPYAQEPYTAARAGGRPADPGDPPMTAPIDYKERTYTLRWRVEAPARRPVVKEVVFAADPSIGTRPRVQKHLMKDAGTGKVIASAEVKAVGAVANPAGGPDVAYPTRVLLKWPEQEFEMDLDLKAAQVNQLGPEQVAARQLFDRPDRLYRTAEPINLANYTPFDPRAGR